MGHKKQNVILLPAAATTCPLTPSAKSIRWSVEIAPSKFEFAADPFDLREVPVEKNTETKQQLEEAGLEMIGLHWLTRKISKKLSVVR